jgi:hypothetical protein
LRRALLVGFLALFAVAASCDDGATAYEVVVRFNTTVTQDDLDETAAILRAYDADLDFVVQESFPPTGVATLETDAADFCASVWAALEAKTYVDGATCREAQDVPASENPDAPVAYP